VRHHDLISSNCIKRSTDNVPKDIASGDFNGDGITDMLLNGVVTDLRNGLGLFLGNGDGTFVPAGTLIGDVATDIHVADINADGRQDIIFGSRGGAYLGNGDGSFIDGGAGGETGVALGDVNGDGITDVLGLFDVNLASGTVSRLHISTYSTATNFTLSHFDFPELVKGMAIFDLNQDSFDDVIVRLQSGSVNVYLSTGDGNLLDAQSVSIVGSGIQQGNELIATGDWNEDGFVDLAQVSIVIEQDSSLWVSLQTPFISTDSIAPSISWLSPLAASKIANVVSLTATATDNSGIAKVDFYLANSLIGTSVGPEYSVSFDTLTVPDGNHVLIATATDVAGNVTSSNLSIIIANAVPTIISSPTLSGIEVGSLFTYSVLATGIAPLNYSLPNAPTGMTIDSASGIISWTSMGAQIGANAVTVQVANAVASSQQSFVVSIIDTTAPTIPTGEHVTSTDPDISVSLAWDASSDVVGVAGYRVYKYFYRSQFNQGWFLLADNIVGLATTVAWHNPLDGTSFSTPVYGIRAYDAAGNESGQSGRIFTPEGSNTAPVVSVSSSSSLVTLPSNLTLFGNATDDGLPGPSLSYLWSYKSVGGVVSFSNIGGAATDATFSTIGQYELLSEVLKNRGHRVRQAKLKFDELP